jgi:hypothetical protein
MGRIKDGLAFLVSRDDGPAWVSEWGVNGVPVSADISAAAVAVTGVSHDNEYVVIDDFLLGSGAVAEVLTFTDAITGKTVAIVRVPANTTVQYTLRGKLRLPSKNSYLKCQSSAAGTSDVAIGWHSEA